MGLRNGPNDEEKPPPAMSFRGLRAACKQEAKTAHGAGDLQKRRRSDCAIMPPYCGWLFLFEKI